MEQSDPVPDLLFRLLKSVDTKNSLAAAAIEHDVSYRTAWNLCNKWAEKLGAPLLVSKKGKGAELADSGAALLAEHYRIEKQSHEFLKGMVSETEKTLSTAFASKNEMTLSVSASHCLSHEKLKALYKKHSSQQFNLQHMGSEMSLKMLAAGECDVAGFHIVQGDLQQYFANRFSDLIDPQLHSVVNVMKRKQGLMVKSGNPKNIRSINDLTKPGIQFVNRQNGSGTRLLLDALLQKEEIMPSMIEGYDTVEFTHSAVGALVASGAVDIAIGNQASADYFGLSFIFLAEENYYFALRNELVKLPMVEALINTLNGDSWKQYINGLSGFNAENASVLSPADQIFIGQ